MSLRRERARAGLSLTELAQRAGIAKSTLSQLENGVGNPSLETLWALAQALGIPLSRLVDPPRQGDPGDPRGGGGGHARRARRLRRGAAVVLPAGRAPRHLPGHRAAGRAPSSPPHMPGTMEHLILGSGRVLAGPEGEALELGPGDYLRYPGDILHVFDALEPDTTGIIIMEHV